MSECTKGELEYTVLDGTQIPATLFIKPDDGIDVDIAVFEKWETDWAKEEMEANAKELVRRWNAFEDGGIVDKLRTALEKIKDLETDCCPRCEGGGHLWTDGKAHFPHEKVDTIPCGSCRGSGRILPENAQNIAEAALAKSQS